MAERERRIAGLGALWALIREDLRHNGGISYPGFQAVALYRFGVWKDGIDQKALRVPFTLLYRVAYIFVRNVYGIELPCTVMPCWWPTAKRRPIRAVCGSSMP